MRVATLEGGREGGMSARDGRSRFFQGNVVQGQTYYAAYVRTRTHTHVHIDK